MKATLAIFLHSSTYDRLYQAVSMVLAGTSMGWSCHLFLFYQALASYVAGGWDNTDTIADTPEGREQPSSLRRGFETSNVRSLYEMLDRAREMEGTLTVYACSGSVQIQRLDIHRVRDMVDEVVGLPTMLEISGGATHVLYI